MRGKALILHLLNKAIALLFLFVLSGPRKPDKEESDCDR